MLLHLLVATYPAECHHPPLRACVSGRALRDGASLGGTGLRHRKALGCDLDSISPEQKWSAEVGPQQLPPDGLALDVLGNQCLLQSKSQPN